MRRALMGQMFGRRGRFDKPVPTDKLAVKQAEKRERVEKAKAMAKEGRIPPEASPFGVADYALARQRARRKVREQGQ